MYCSSGCLSSCSGVGLPLFCSFASQLLIKRKIPDFVFCRVGLPCSQPFMFRSSCVISTAGYSSAHCLICSCVTSNSLCLPFNGRDIAVFVSVFAGADASEKRGSAQDKSLDLSKIILLSSTSTLTLSLTSTLSLRLFSVVLGCFGLFSVVFSRSDFRQVRRLAARSWRLGYIFRGRGQGHAR